MLRILSLILPLLIQTSTVSDCLNAQKLWFVLQLEDCALQLCKHNSLGQGDYGIYLDLESTLDDQQEELEGFNEQ